MLSRRIGWGLPPISKRSRDNLPNPQQEGGSYVPTNRPAIGDLMDMFGAVPDFTPYDVAEEDNRLFDWEKVR